MHWSLEKYLIADDCQLRLTLTGTISSTEQIVKIFREKFVTGELSDCELINKTSMLECLGRMSNVRRHADYVVPPGTRYNFKKNDLIFSVPLDFVSIFNNEATVYFVSKKKYKGTVSQSYGYISIAEAIKRLFPEVERFFIREILMLPVTIREVQERILVVAPPFEVFTDTFEHAFNKVLSNMKMNRKQQKDLRKCRIATDPCPARDICPAVKEKKSARSKHKKGEERAIHSDGTDNPDIDSNRGLPNGNTGRT